LLQKERKERMVLMHDEDFEGDFLEVEENIRGIANAASAVLLLIRSKERYENDFRKRIKMHY
jgi:homoserine acetyltransferase